MKKILTLHILFSLSISMFAQPLQTDSLINVLKNETTDTGRIRTLIKIGTSLDLTRTKTDSTTGYLQAAVDLAKKSGHLELELEAVYYLANNLINSANYPRALVLSLENLKKLEQLKREKNVAITFNNNRDLIFYQTRLLVFIYSGIRDYKRQLDYVKKMQVLHKSIPKQNGVDNYALTIFYNLGNAYDNLKIYDSAFHYRLILYKEVHKTNDAQWLALAAGALGASYEEYKVNLDSAMFLLRESIPAAEKSSRRDLAVINGLFIGRVHQKKGQRDSAFFYTRQALQRLSQTNSPSQLLQAYNQISTLYQEEKQYDSAYYYLQNATVLKDSLHDLTKLSDAQNFVFNQTLLDQEVAQAKKEAGQEAETKIKVYALAGIIFIILLAGFFLMRNLKHKRAANILLTKQKEEIQNNLLVLKQTQAQLIQSEKMASLGELTAGIAHEIQNPLNFVNNFSEINKELISELVEQADQGNTQEVKEIAKDIKSNEEKINQHGKRADAIVKGMLQHSQSSSGKKEPTDINKLADEYLKLSYHGLLAKDKSFNATIKTYFDESIGNVNIISQDIGRVLLNLFNNAFYAVKETADNRRLTTDSSYKPTVSVSTRKVGDKIKISVSDNGNGIPSNIVDKIFQPFFTTKPTGQGTGLGLSLAYDIIKAHGGELKVATEPGTGTTFIIQLPAL